MKKILTITFIALFGLALSSCGRHMYSTQSGGMDNVSYIIVLKEAGRYDNVAVVVDGETYPYPKVFKVKAKRKAPQIFIEPGKHNVKVLVGGEVVTDENIFIAVQETKTVVLR